MSFVAIPDTINVDERLAAISERAELFFRSLLTIVDAHGRVTANPKALNGLVWPLRERSAKDTERALTECEEAKLVSVYEHEGVRWVQVERWDDLFQQVGANKSKRPKSRYPDRDQIAMASRSQRDQIEQVDEVGTGTGTGTEGEPERETQSRPALSLIQKACAGGGLDRLRSDPGWSSLEAFWPEWEAYRREIKKPMTERSAVEQLRQAQEWGAAVWVGRARSSIANGWQGVFPDRGEARLRVNGSGHAGEQAHPCAPIPAGYKRPPPL